MTGSCWEVARILEPYVDRVIVVSPDDTGIANARAKTDKLDARVLASLLWRGELEAVWMPDERCRILRRRLARREQLVHSRSRSKNEIHAVLQRRLQGKPPCSDLFGVKGRAWLAGLELPDNTRRSTPSPDQTELTADELPPSVTTTNPLHPEKSAPQDLTFIGRSMRQRGSVPRKVPPDVDFELAASAAQTLHSFPLIKGPDHDARDTTKVLRIVDKVGHGELGRESVLPNQGDRDRTTLVNLLKRAITPAIRTWYPTDLFGLHTETLPRRWRFNPDNAIALREGCSRPLCCLSLIRLQAAAFRSEQQRSLCGSSWNFGGGP